MPPHVTSVVFVERRVYPRLSQESEIARLVHRTYPADGYSIYWKVVRKGNGQESQRLKISVEEFSKLVASGMSSGNCEITKMVTSYVELRLDGTSDIYEVEQFELADRKLTILKHKRDFEYPHEKMILQDLFKQLINVSSDEKYKTRYLADL